MRSRRSFFVDVSGFRDLFLTDSNRDFGFFFVESGDPGGHSLRTVSGPTGLLLLRTRIDDPATHQNRLRRGARAPEDTDVSVLPVKGVDVGQITRVGTRRSGSTDGPTYTASGPGRKTRPRTHQSPKGSVMPPDAGPASSLPVRVARHLPHRSYTRPGPDPVSVSTYRRSRGRRDYKHGTPTLVTELRPGPRRRDLGHTIPAFRESRRGLIVVETKVQ